MAKLDKLTYSQKVALEGEIAKMLKESMHKEEVLHRVYCVLKNVPVDYKDVIVECLLNMSDISEEEMLKILMEISLETTPLWLWFNRTIKDIKSYISSNGSIEDYVSTASDSKERSTYKKLIAKSCFMFFCRNCAFKHYSATKELLYKVLEDDELEFLYDTCYYLLEEIKSIKKKNSEPEIVMYTLDFSKPLSYQAETTAISELVKMEKRKRARKKAESDSVIKEDLENISDTGVSIRDDKPVQEYKNLYVVKKTFKSSSRSSVLKVFSSRDEAVNFIKGIINEYPDIAKVCDFTIEHEIKR